MDSLPSVDIRRHSPSLPRQISEGKGHILSAELLAGGLTRKPGCRTAPFAKNSEKGDNLKKNTLLRP